MNAKELLKATMNAAGDANLTDWHETLVTTEKRVSRNDGVSVDSLLPFLCVAWIDG